MSTTSVSPPRDIGEAGADHHVVFGGDAARVEHGQRIGHPTAASPGRRKISGSGPCNHPPCSARAASIGQPGGRSSW